MAFQRKITSTIRIVKLKIYLKMLSLFMEFDYQIGSNVKIGKAVIISVRKGSTLTICDDCIIQDYVYINLGINSHFLLGNDSTIERNSHIAVSKNIVIGNNTIIANHCFIIDYDHTLEKKNVGITFNRIRSSPIYIGNFNWIGAYCKILKGSKTQDNTILGCNSLLNMELNKPGKYVGCPIRKI